MSVASKTSKSSGPQDLKRVPELPAAAWDVDKLQEYAKQRHAELDQPERSLARIYWQLGAALKLLRDKLHPKHGQWEEFLSANKISTTRAAKARAIFETFASLDKVTGLSVDEAYGKRKVKQPRAAKAVKQKKPATAELTTPQTFQVSLQDVVEQANAFQSERLQRFPEQTPKMLEAVAAAIEKLEALRQRLLASPPTSTKG